MALSRALKDKFHREYMTFFEHAERSRRWNLFTDIDWEAVKNEPRNDKLALCAETFMGVELYLPDYIDGHLSLFRDNFARAWAAARPRPTTDACCASWPTTSPAPFASSRRSPPLSSNEGSRSCAGWRRARSRRHGCAGRPRTTSSCAKRSPSAPASARPTMSSRRW